MLSNYSEPPETQEDLLTRAESMAGHNLAEVAAVTGDEVPRSLRRAKGWVGIVIENYLGATAGNRAVPDFEKLGVELKTIPLDDTGKPRETTYVSTVPLTDIEEVEWRESPVYKKLQTVLWVPVQAGKETPIGERVVGRSLLWSPSEEEEAALRKDWEEHLDVIRRGYIDNTTGRDGEILQIRPKAADASKRTWTVNEDGNSIMTKPRGFYLRTLFTEYLVRRYILGVSDAEWG